MSDVDKNFNWDGQWWNITKGNDRGGVIEIHRVTEWGFSLDSRAWSGENMGNFHAEARKTEGVAVVDVIENTANCRLLLIPGKMARYRCTVMAVGVSYLHAERCFHRRAICAMLKKIRKAPTLLSIGIFLRLRSMTLSVI